MKTIELDTLDARLQDRILAAVAEPILITEAKQPVLVIRSLLEDDVADDLIARHPAFLVTTQAGGGACATTKDGTKGDPVRAERNAASTG